MFIQHRTQYTIQYDQKLRQVARGLRKHPTTAEQILWQAIRSRKLGYKFRRQHPLHGFVVDFYCYELMVVIEVDGSVHNDTIERDLFKDKVLANNGYQVLRFTNAQVLDQLPEVIKKIKGHTNPLS